eukprot:scaffold99992_cov31-Phaeocystis_antarctica.AAC.1
MAIAGSGPARRTRPSPRPRPSTREASCGRWTVARPTRPASRASSIRRTRSCRSASDDCHAQHGAPRRDTARRGGASSPLALSHDAMARA